MKYFLPTIFSILLLLIFFSPFNSLSQISNLELESKTLKALEYDWLIAEFKLDTATISKMMDASFISINSSGILSKQQELDGMYKNISERLFEKHFVDSLYLDDFLVRILGSTAIVTFITVTKGSIKGIKFTNRRTRFYDVWIKLDSEWKAVSSQVTPLQ